MKMKMDTTTRMDYCSAKDDKRRRERGTQNERRTKDKIEKTQFSTTHKTDPLSKPPNTTPHHITLHLHQKGQGQVTSRCPGGQLYIS